MTSQRPRVILASASPRRRELLTLIGVPHEVRPANIPEQPLPGEHPAAYSERLAREKASAVAEPGTVTIGSDTIVIVDGDILEKPAGPAEAAGMLRRLSGRSHRVITAVAVVWDGRVSSAAVEVEVTFRRLSDADIAGYIATGEPMDKSGAYGIQGYGATIVERVNGDYFAVMGLPLERLVRLLTGLGLRYDFGPIEAPRDAG